MKKFNYRITCKSDPRFDMVGILESESMYSATIKIINIIFNKAKEFDIIESNLPDDLNYSCWPTIGMYTDKNGIFRSDL